MDILDIDQALNDNDLSKFLEDDTEPGDVSDILKQWRTTTNNNNIHEQGFKLNTRTFTRPKRRTVLNLESQFKDNMETSQTISPQIGGLVTTLQKSFLQDTSPPPSICSSFSMDYSIDRLNNSLITSADFSSVSAFFQTSATQEDLGNTFLESNYSISDLIRDRKTLDNLTMSGDSTIIKDSNIAHIDDVSLMSSSTINNSSTDSLSGSADLPQNNTVILNTTFEAKNCDATFTNGKKPDLTFDTIENTSMVILNTTEVISKDNATFVEPKKPQDDTFTKPLNETFEKLCGTPETSFRIEQSTPHHTKFAPGKKFTLLTDEVNLSPITSVKNAVVGNASFADGTYEENILKASCEGSNEEDFYDLLDKFGKYTPSAEKVKIQRSVDSIKKKYVQPTTANGEEKSSLSSSFVIKESGEGSGNNSMTSSGNVCNKLTSSSTSLTTSTDRLLNRRGRLYDDIQMNISQKSLSLKESITTSNGGEKDENTAAANSESLEGGLDQIEQETPVECEKRKTEIVNKKSGKIRDHDRFKTIKISKRSDEINEQQLNVPCIDNEFDQEPQPIEEAIDSDVNQRFSRKDSQFNSPSNFLTYKKPKEKMVTEPPTLDPVQSNARSLSRPRYISGLQKLSLHNKESMAKAASADDLEKSSTSSSTTDLTEDSKALNVNRFGLKKFSVGAQSRPSEVKSPMGNKAKSLHNLSNNFGFVAKKPGLKAPSVPAPSSRPSRPVSAYVQKAPESVFKVPQANPPVALRKTSTTSATAPAARKGMMRPSSGYYGSSSSAASTKSTDSLNSLNETTVQSTQPKSMGLPKPKTMGIPKPSGLRPPSSTVVKKSGLPRPASIVRR